MIDGRSSTRSLVGTPKFSPKLKLTKVAVGRLVKLPQRSVECRTAVEGEEADGHESVESHLPMIVSYHLTEGLQRCITKVMRKRRKEQELSRKDARKRWRQKKSVYPKRQQLQHPASAASEATLLVAESGDLSVFDPAGELGTVVEGELEVQPDAIMKPFLVSQASVYLWGGGGTYPALTFSGLKSTFFYIYLAGWNVILARERCVCVWEQRG